MKTPQSCARQLALGFGLTAATLYAQTAPGLPAASSAPVGTIPNPTSNETAIELSPFVVTTDKDVGYLAANTLSGSRLNTKLYDTSASISEMTQEFLLDIGANDTMAAVDYALGFESDRPGATDNTSQFNSQNVVARGVGRSGTVARDFFSWNLSSDVFSTERLSLSRGPNSVLYGIGNAGGIINSTSKRASFRPLTEVNLRVDANNSWRVHLDRNQPLGEKFALRVNLLADDMRTWRDLEYTKDQRAHLAGTWRPFKRTEIRADYERGRQDRLIGLRFSARDYFLQWADAGSPAYDRAINGNTYPAGTVAWGTTPRLGYNADDSQWFNYQRFARTRGRGGLTNNGIKLANETYLPYSAVIGGPASTSDNTYWTGSAFLQQEVVRNLYIELAVNKQYNERTVLRGVSQDFMGLMQDPNKTLPNGAINPRYGQFFMEGQALKNVATSDTLNKRASLTYELDSKNNWLGHHRWLALATSENSDNLGKQLNEANLTPLSPTVPALTNAQNAINRRTYLNFNGGNRYYNHDPFRTIQAPIPFTDSVNGLAGTITPGFFVSNLNPSTAANEALMIAGQSTFLKDRLVFTYGFRHDKAQRQNSVLVRNVTTQEVTDATLTPTSHYSGNTQTLGSVVHLAQWVSVYGNRSQNFTPQSALDVSGENIGNVQGKGRDYGLKFRLGDNRLYARVGCYKSSAVGTVARNSTMIFNIQNIWLAIEGASGPHAVKFTGSPANNTDTQDFDVEEYEAEVTANPFKGLALTLNYATLNGRTTNLYPNTRAHVAQNRALWTTNGSLLLTTGGGGTVGGTLAAIDALQVQDDLQNSREGTGNYRDSFNAFGRYEFQTELLKGWSVGAGTRFRTGRVLGYNASAQPIRAPDLFLADANLAYRRPIWSKKVNLRLQLNIQNLFNNHDLIWASIDPVTYAKNDYTLFTPRQLTLSASFQFR
jgi:outer membrane receptor for ferric coprogen and ferric-rhodotorulic acid